MTRRKTAYEENENDQTMVTIVIDIEETPADFLAKMCDIIIPEELAHPMKIPLKFILTQCHRGTCKPIVLTEENVLVDGIAQYKVAKLLKWNKIPAIIQKKVEAHNGRIG